MQPHECSLRKKNRATRAEGAKVKSAQAIAHGDVPATDVAGRIAEFAVAIKANPIPPDVVERLKTCLVNSLGCVLAAFDEEPVRVSREGVLRLCGDGPSSILGARRRSSPDLAGFANGVAVRYLDANDVYHGVGGGIHPSDATWALVALAESEHRSGEDLLRSLAATNEVVFRLCDTAALAYASTDPYFRGWEGVTLLALATAAGASALLDLDRERTRQAIGIAGVTAASLRQTRLGDVSMWSAAAGPDVARRGAVSAVMAAGGMTGPTPIFEGEYGLFRMVTGEFEWPLDDRWRTREVEIKRYPAVGFAQTAIEAAIALRSRGVRADEVEKLVIRTFPFGSATAAYGEERGHPKTRKTADHSLVYCASIALLDGEVTKSQFTPERLRAADIARLLDRVEVTDDPAYADAYPQSTPTRLDAHLRGGCVESAEVKLTAGHPQRPLSRQDSGRLVEELLKDGGFDMKGVRQVMARMWAIDDLADVCDLGLAGLGRERP